MATVPTPTSHNDDIVAVPNNVEARVKYIQNTLREVVQMLAQKSKKAQGLPNLNDEGIKTLLIRLQQFMRWLDTNVEISPKLRKRSKIDEGLKLIFADPRFKFPEPYPDQAKLLNERWEDSNWGADEVSDDEELQEMPTSSTTTSEPLAKRRKSSSVALSEIGIAKAPPKAHPIYGINGIMHGVCIMQGKARKDYILDNRYPKRNAKVYGHNSLKVGQWFAFQIIAPFHGAHGVKMGGIAGNSQTGAYSIVVSGAYDALDKDLGETIYYSGSNSHSNTDRTAPAPSTAATQSLHASQLTEKPVRVLRAAAGHGMYAPSVGIRYDGLYRVVDMRLRTNEKEGKYEQFVLKRLEGQESLESIAKRSPTKQQKADHKYIHSGY